MRLKRSLDARKIFVGLYILAFSTYLIIGLRPAEAINYAISAKLSIPKISLDADVTTLSLDDGRLNTPDEIVGSYSRAKNKTMLIGHSTTIFANLSQIGLGDQFSYADQNYKVIMTETIPKYQVDMNQLLASANQDTLVIMTCAGQLLDDGDATHRLILTAIQE